MFLTLINIDTIKTDNENQMEQYFYYVYDGQNKTHLQCHINRKLKKKISLYTSMVWSVIPMKYSILKVTLQFFLYLFNRKMKKNILMVK